MRVRAVRWMGEGVGSEIVVCLRFGVPAREYARPTKVGHRYLFLFRAGFPQSCSFSFHSFENCDRGRDSFRPLVRGRGRRKRAIPNWFVNNFDQRAQLFLIWRVITSTI